MRIQVFGLFLLGAVGHANGALTEPYKSVAEFPHGLRGQPGHQRRLLPEVGPSREELLELQKNAEPEPEPRFLVLFDETLPDDFEDEVNDMGGVNLFSHPSGFAVVAGITDEQAESINARLDVVSFHQDDTYDLEESVDDVVSESESDSVTSSSDPATAYFYPRQYNMRVTRANEAWDLGKLGSEDVKVAILDTGIDPYHKDLENLVDMVDSTTFATYPDNDYVDYYFHGRPYFTDLHAHGTHVAATVSSNAIAAAGVTSKTKLMAVKVCNFWGSCYTWATLSGIFYAVDHGADVINMSLGGLLYLPDYAWMKPYIERAFNYAKKNKVTIAVSAGNSNFDLDAEWLQNYYAVYCDAPHVLCVSATGPDDRDSINGPWDNKDAKASYSNYGSQISVAAPGGTGYGLIWAACSTTSLWYWQCSTLPGIWVVGMSGTSMASPQVAGQAALLYAELEEKKRDPAKVRHRIRQFADDCGKVAEDKVYGKGRVNIIRAVEKDKVDDGCDEPDE